MSLRPLTTEEVQIELRGWFDLLREKTREVRDAELKLEKLAEGASDEELRKQLVASTCNSG